MLVVWHRFGGRSERMELNLPRPGPWSVARDWGHPVGLATLREEKMVWMGVPEWSGGVLLLDNAG
jgi:hypothetical protein